MTLLQIRKLAMNDAMRNFKKNPNAIHYIQLERAMLEYQEEVYSERLKKEIARSK